MYESVSRDLLGEGRAGELGGSCTVGGACNNVTMTCQNSVCRCDNEFFQLAGTCSESSSVTLSS